jgi:hypothetical protein
MIGRPLAPIVTTVACLAVLVLPSCSSCGDDGPGVDNMVATAERWLRVLSSPGRREGEGTIVTELDVVPVNDDGAEGRPRLERIAVHSSFLDGIREAMGDGDAVYLAMSSEGLVREMVSYVIARRANGEHRFLGECVAEGEILLRDRLGSGYDRTMEKVIGSTDADRILSSLEAG